MEISFACAGFDTLGQRFASVYDALESQKLCISDISSGSTVHQALPKGVRVSCLVWASQPSKKRKRSLDSGEDLIIMGSPQKILVYSVSRNELQAYDGSVESLAWFKGSLYGMSDSELIKFDKFKPVEAFEHDASSVFSAGDELVVCSTAPQLLSSDLEDATMLPGFTTPVANITTLTEGFAASAQEDRQVQIYAGENHSSFMCPSNVVHLTSHSEYLAAVLEDGLAHVYKNGKEVSQVAVKRSSGAIVAIHKVYLDGEFMLVAWPEVGASVAVVERVKWFKGEPLKEVVTIKDQELGTIKAAKDEAPSNYNESRATHSHGDNYSALDESDDEVTLAERLEALEVVQDEEEEESTLKVAAPGSFAVLLNQALTNDDKQLLETCIAERDERMIKSSIVRLEPVLATKLLERLAEKISRTQHRSSRLLTWIRWCLVAHGGYLVTVPSLLKTLASLYSTLTARTATLPKLLALQGRLDLLNAQMDLREEIISSRRSVEDEDEAEFVYNEEEFIANGEEDLADSSEGEEAEGDDDQDLEAEDDAMDSDVADSDNSMDSE